MQSKCEYEQKGANWNVGTEHSNNKKINNLNKQSHIQIGENTKFYADTTH
jgi:hypothetical protein